jgi:hypothetical protein
MAALDPSRADTSADMQQDLLHYPQKRCLAQICRCSEACTWRGSWRRGDGGDDKWRAGLMTLHTTEMAAHACAKRSAIDVHAILTTLRPTCAVYTKTPQLTRALGSQPKLERGEGVLGRAEVQWSELFFQETLCASRTLKARWL